MLKRKRKKKGLRGINILPKFSSSWAIKNHQRFIHSDRLALMILLMLIIIIFIFFLACIALIVWVESPISLCFFFCFFAFQPLLNCRVCVFLLVLLTARWASPGFVAVQSLTYKQLNHKTTRAIQKQPEVTTAITTANINRTPNSLQLLFLLL